MSQVPNSYPGEMQRVVGFKPTTVASKDTACASVRVSVIVLP